MTILLALIYGAGIFLGFGVLCLLANSKTAAWLLGEDESQDDG